jgi:non-heme chloroperoxidase
MPYVTVGKENSGSIDLYYEDHGAGRPVVLIHGWPQSGASWEKQVRALLDAGYRAITYDRRGFGLSARPATGYDYDTLADDLHALVVKLDLRDVALVGFSMGGGEVARYASRHGSDRMSSATFISAIPPFLLKTPDNPDATDQSVFDGILAGLAADRPAFLTAFLANFYNVDVLRGKMISDDQVRAVWNLAVSASPIATSETVKAWLTDFRRDLAAIRVPTLVIHGDADRIVPIDISGRRTHQMVKGSQLVVVEGGPHGLTLTHADLVSRELIRFIDAGAKVPA